MDHCRIIITRFDPATNSGLSVVSPAQAIFLIFLAQDCTNEKSCATLINRMAGVAKWLRQWIVVPPFVGSSPIVRPIRKPTEQLQFPLFIPQRR